MKILVIGGSVFVGRAIVAAALASGHEVTVFNRGKSSSVDATKVTWLRGDRDGDLAILSFGQWDAVIDTCAYFPRQVRTLLAALCGRIGHYTLISSVSAYADLGKPGVSEADVLSPPAGDDVDKVTMESYGPLKAACEQVAMNAEGIKSLIVRPGIIVGPYDPTDRFSYWVSRLADGGEVLAPGSPAVPFQVIDVRDLADWIVAAVERGLTGAFNTVGPREPLTFGDMLLDATHALLPTARLNWVSDEFLTARSTAHWGALPLYLPKTMKPFAGMFAINGSKAFGSGLTLRPLSETVADTQAWLMDRKPVAPLKVGLTRQVEAELLEAWTACEISG
jgi:2'-hydroxyisoflavone reductase